MIDLQKILQIFCPARCIFCGNYGEEICTQCWNKVYWFSNAHCCDICGAPMQYKLDCVCKNCTIKRPIFDKAISIFEYTEFSKFPILRLKNNDATYLVDIFARLITRSLKSIVTGNEIIIPIPLHRKKLMKRRYNQSALLAKKIAKLLNMKYRPLLLEKITNTLPQEGLNRDARLRNVVGSFNIHKRIDNVSIILIDDVMTTGATADECSKILKQNGAKRVTVATIAKVL